MSDRLPSSILQETMSCRVTLTVMASLTAVALVLRKSGVAMELIGVSYQTVMARGQWWRVLAGGVAHQESLHLIAVVIGLWHTRIVELRHGSIFYAAASAVLLVGSSVLVFTLQRLALYSEARFIRRGWLPTAVLGSVGTLHLSSPYTTCTVGYSPVVFGFLVLSNFDDELPFLITALWLMGFKYLAPQASATSNVAAVMIAVFFIQTGLLADFLPSAPSASASLTTSDVGKPGYYWPSVLFSGIIILFIASRRATIAETLRQVGPRGAELQEWPGERGCFFEHVLQHVDAQLFVFPHPNAIENLRNTLENSTMLDAADSDEREAAAAPEEASSELPEALMYSNLVDRTSMLLPILRVDAAVATALGLNSRHRGPPPSSPLTSLSVPPDVASGGNELVDVDVANSDAAANAAEEGTVGGRNRNSRVHSRSFDDTDDAESFFVLDDGTLPPAVRPLPHPVCRWLNALVRPVTNGAFLRFSFGVGSLSRALFRRTRFEMSGRTASDMPLDRAPLRQDNATIGSGDSGNNVGGGTGGFGVVRRGNVDGALSGGWLPPVDSSSSQRLATREESALAEAIGRSLLSTEASESPGMSTEGAANRVLGEMSFDHSLPSPPAGRPSYSASRETDAAHLGSIVDMDELANLM